MRKIKQKISKPDGQKSHIPIMLISPTNKETAWFKKELQSHGNGIFDILSFPSWKEAILELGQKKPEIILIQFHKDYAEDIDSTARIHSFAPDVPILVVGNVISTEIELQAIHAGAQNYLHRDDITGQSLMREILYSFARQHRVNKVHVLREVFHQKSIKKNFKKNARIDALQRLWSGIAHDFNNIIGSIYGYAELIDEQLHAPVPEIDASREHITLIMNAAEKARSLVEQIAALGSRTETPIDYFDIALVTREAVNFLKSSLPSSIRVTSTIDFLAGMLKGDPVSFFHTAVSLGLEASNRITNSTGTLHIDLKPTESCVIHSDSGTTDLRNICITLDIVSTTTGDAESPKPTSARRPVVMAKQLATFLLDMRAVVRRWESCTGGLHGEICIPLNPVAPSPEKAQPCQIGHGERLLLIDDDPNLSNAERRMLEKLGFKVHVFNDPKKALQSFLDSPSNYDLVITDLTMPDLSGREIASTITSAGHKTPIILSTGRMEKRITTSLGLRFPILRKPYKKQALLEAIRTALDQTHEKSPDSR